MTEEEDIRENKGISWLAYISVLFLIPMLAKKDSKFCEYHVRQGAMLFVLEIAFTVVSQLFLAVIGAVIRGIDSTTYYIINYHMSPVYMIFNVLFLLVDIAFVVLSVMGIFNALGGRKKELPIIGKIPLIEPLLDKFYSKN